MTFLTFMAFAQQSNDTQPSGKNPRLGSVLSQMISADNPQDFARVHNLFMQDGKVRVVVELANENANLPEYVIEEIRYENRVQALVQIDKLEALSKETNVSFIRLPLEPYADISTTPIIPNKTEVPVPKTGFSTTMTVIFSIILVFLLRKNKS